MPPARQERYLRTKALFAELRELPESEREAFLERECAGDVALRDEVLELLACDEGRTGDALDRALLDDGGECVRPTLPRSIAGYRIVGLCGVGGMGAVYEAEQHSPPRRVALKVIQSGAASKELLRRFARESAILERLRHPGIAEVYDAGEFEHEGIVRPYFAMEYIEGRSLLEFADERALSSRARVELFLGVCDAVQYAHTRGVVHRDLKPDNVLVDGSGRPKVLDFGVARLVDSETQVTLATGTGQLLGSVPYMSPEQAGGGAGDVGVPSDLYSLGVMLFELLAGHLPYDVRSCTLPNAIELIRTGEPQRLGSAAPALRSDLETIAGKCLEKEPERRYASVGELADDLRRFLVGEPIAARPPSTWYQLSKFAHRNRALVGGVAGTMVALAIGIVVAVVFAIQASRSEELATDSAAQAARAAYRANLNAASALVVGDPVKARRTLEDVPLEQRGWEWHVLFAQLDIELLEFGSGQGRVLALSDGALVVARDGERDVRVWETDTGREARALSLPAEVTALAASPDGAVLAVGLTDGRVLVTDPRADAAGWTAIVEPNGEAVQALAVAPSALRLAVHRGEELRCGAPGSWATAAVGARYQHAPDLMFSADGAALFHHNRFVTTVFDALALEPLRSRPSDTYGPRSCALSADGRWLAYGCTQRQVVVVDAETLEEVRVLRGHQGAVHGVRFDAGGRLLSVSGLDVRVWDVLTGAVLAVIPVAGAGGAAFVSRGRVVSSGPDVLRLWDPGITRARVLGQHARYAYEVAFSPDGDLLASRGYFADVLVWDVSGGRRLGELSVEAPSAPFFDRAGERIAFVGWNDPEVVPWVGGEPATLRAPRGFVHQFGDDAVWVDGARFPHPNDGDLVVWRTEHTVGAAPRVFADGRALEPTTPFDVGALGPHPRLVVGDPAPHGFEGTLAELIVVAGHPTEAESRAIESYLAARRGGVAGELPVPAGPASVVAHFRASEEAVARDDDGYVLAWRDARDPARELVAVGWPRSRAAFRPAREGAPAEVHVVENPHGTRILETPLDELAGADRVAVFWLGRYHVASHGYRIGTTPMQLRDWGDHDARARRVSSHRVYGRADAERAWVANTARNGGALTVRDAVTGALITHVDENPYHHLAVSPDGARLACGDARGVVHVFDTVTWERATSFDAHAGGAAYAVDWSPDGARLATGGNDSVIRIWDAATYELLLELTDHTLYVKDLRFSPDGTMMASASGDSTVRLWDTVAPAERYRRSLEHRAAEDAVRAQVEGWWRASSDPSAVMESIRAEWPEGAAPRSAAMRVLAGLWP